MKDLKEAWDNLTNEQQEDLLAVEADMAGLMFTPDSLRRHSEFSMWDADVDEFVLTKHALAVAKMGRLMRRKAAQGGGAL